MIIEDILYLSNTYYNLCSNGSKNKTAVIIKGNPKFIDNNKDADSFYEEIKSFLEDLGFEVSFDKGEPYTSPDKADLWIGHSRGADRLR